MNFRTTLFLLVLVVAVAVIVFFTNRHDENTKPAPDKTEARKLVDFDSADVTRVSITNSDDKHVVLQKTGSDWKLVEPVAARAKSFEVDDLVRALTALKSRGQLEASKNTSGGLDHPSFVVELTTKNNKTTKFSFGDKSDVGDSLYVLVDDAAKPDIIGNSIYATLDKPATNYRDMKLVTTSSSDIKQLAITEKGKTIKLEKTGENWQITEPQNIPAETSAVTDLLSSLTSLDATEFVEKPSEVAKYSLSHPRLSVAFSTAKPTTQPAATQPGGEPELSGGETIRFGTYQDILKKGVFASLNGKDVAVVSATSEKSFEKTPLDLRNRDVADIAPDRVSSFTLSIFTPATQPATRPILGPELPPGATPAATQSASSPTTKPGELREFTIERHKVAVPAPATTQPSSATTQPAVATTQPSVPSTQPSVATTQPSAPTTQPVVTATDPSTLTTQPAVATTQPAATQPDELATAKWAFTSGGHGAAEEGQVTELLSSLHPLRAEKYLEPEKATGATYTLTIHVIPATAGESAEDFVLTFIDAGTRVDGYYKDLHFEVNRSLIEKLTGDFKTKKPTPPPSDPHSFPGSGAGGLPFGG